MARLTPGQAKTLRILIWDAGYEATDYSGRGMMGQRCIGFTSKDRLTEVIGNLVECSENQRDAANVVRSMCTDGMGTGTIYYWPSAPTTPAVVSPVGEGS